ncbi:MAG: hypothetical protein IPO86_05280 [Saprospiraceae bacterium]|nr:hypothetical protein [Saprospiraceae bacterium]
MNIIKTKTLAILQSSPINPFWNDEYPLILNDRFPILLDGVEKCNHSLMEDKKTKMLLIRMWILKRKMKFDFQYL